MCSVDKGNDSSVVFLVCCCKRMKCAVDAYVAMLACTNIDDQWSDNFQKAYDNLVQAVDSSTSDDLSELRKLYANACLRLDEVNAARLTLDEQKKGTFVEQVLLFHEQSLLSISTQAMGAMVRLQGPTRTIMDVSLGVR